MNEMKKLLCFSRLLPVALALSLLLTFAACDNSEKDMASAVTNTVSEFETDKSADSSEDGTATMDTAAEWNMETFLDIWSIAVWEGGASEDYLGAWKDDSADEWPYLYVYNNIIVFESDDGMRMNVSPYFVCDEDIAELDLDSGWLGIGGSMSMSTETMLLLTDEGSIVVDNADSSLDFSSFPRGQYLPLEPYDLSYIDDIANITSDEELDEYGNTLLKYQEFNITYEWTTEEEVFYMYGSIINDLYDEAGLDIFRDYTISGQNGVFDKFSIDGESRLDVLQAMGAVSADGEMLHESIQILHVQSEAAIQVIMLSRDSDGITHIAALTYDKDEDAYGWDGETNETRDMCVVSRYGRFCYVDEFGYVATTVKP